MSLAMNDKSFMVKLNVYIDKNRSDNLKVCTILCRPMAEEQIGYKFSIDRMYSKLK